MRAPVAGRLAAERSVAAIRDAIAALLADPPARAATRAYAERYDWAETGRRHRALIAAAVAGDPGDALTASV